MPEWTDGQWTRPPSSLRRSAGGLVVGAAEGSDWWRRTLYGFDHDDGHALLTTLPGDSAVEVAFDIGSLTELYDQAGLLLRCGPDQWIKAGVEVSDGVAQLATVVTRGSSDWSIAPVAASTRIVTIRLSRLGDSVVVRARAAGLPWSTLRVSPALEGGPALAGPSVCAPTRSGLEVTFVSWEHTPADAELHPKGDP